MQIQPNALVGREITMKENRIVITRVDANKLGDLIVEARNQGYRGSTYLNDLAAEVDRAILVEPKEIPPDVITMNSKVQLFDIENDEHLEYTLVFPEDADVKQGKISVLAPIGTAMLGYRVGDEFIWQTPGGSCRYRVEKILYQPEASGDYHL